MREESEPRYPRSLSGARVDPMPSGLVPARRALDGRHVRLEPLDPATHAADLYEASHVTESMFRCSHARPPTRPDVQHEEVPS